MVTLFPTKNVRSSATRSQVFEGSGEFLSSISQSLCSGIMYYKLIQFSSVTSGGLQKKKKRVWNRHNYCLFCPCRGTNISKHLRIHVDQEEVKKIISLDARLKCTKNDHMSKQISARLEILRNKGNHKHNKEVMDHGEGEIILARRPKNQGSAQGGWGWSGQTTPPVGRPPLQVGDHPKKKKDFFNTQSVTYVDFISTVQVCCC